MREEPVRFPSGPIVLQGSLSMPGAVQQVPGVVVCHPHPLYGGSMDNNVVLGLARALASRGVAVLRFNFRGAGGSGGSHGGGEAEVEDVGAALDLLGGRGGVDPRRLAVAGYSFGAVVGLRAGCRDPRVQALGLVAPPLAAFPMPEGASCTVPKLVVAGTRDVYCPAARLEAWFANAAELKDRVAVAGADHFLADREDEVGAAVAAFLVGRLGAGGEPT